MPRLILNLEKSIAIPFQPGPTVREILDGTDFRVRTGCTGTGACGLCVVHIAGGEVDAPTSAEEIHLDKAHLMRGMRLACQVRPTRDLEIDLIRFAPKSDWKKPVRRRHQCYAPVPMPGAPAHVSTPKAIAVDLGTTLIRVSLWDVTTGCYVTGRVGLNPQRANGTDVISRLMAASESGDQAHALKRLVMEAIGAALRDMALTEGINLQDVVRVAVVGNTAMLTLLTGCNYDLLLQPKHWNSLIDCLADGPGAWSEDLGIHPEARIEVIPPMAGFVGSDLLAGVAASALTEKGPGGLLIDFGTNSEIALWDGATLWVTSAAGGPAFEGSGIGCGMPAEAGAIQRVFIEEGRLQFDVMGGGEPLGLCGSGLVDLLAVLVRSGRLDAFGRFAASVPRNGWAVVDEKSGIVLTKRDVDVLQRAKAAIAAGVNLLMSAANLGQKALRYLCVSGAFGQCLDVENARQIGLLPDIEAGIVELYGNTALAGCEDALLCEASRSGLERLRACARVINLSHYENFDDLFIDHLFLRPMHIE